MRTRGGFRGGVGVDPWLGRALRMAVAAAVIASLSVGLCGCGAEPGAVSPPDPPLPPPFRPQSVEVVLGTSGSSVTLTTTAGGGYALEGRTFDGGEVRAANGSRYHLALDEGRWKASFLAPEPAVVALGELGSRLEVAQSEDGSYRLGETVLTSGFEYADVASGNTYAFTQGPDGTWTAAYKPVEQEVALGPAGRLVLARAEDGTWFAGDRPVAEGQVVGTGSGTAYRLVLTDGRWSAVFEPAVLPIAGTGLAAESTETGDGYRIGRSATLPASGEGRVTVAGASYHVWREQDSLVGARFDSVPSGTDAAGANFQIGLASGVPQLSKDDPSTPASEDRTAIEVAGAEFSLGELLGTGRASARSPNIVQEANRAITQLLRDTKALMAVADDDPETVRRWLERSWDRVRALVDGIFGEDTIAVRTELRPTRALRALDGLAEALASRSAFREATAEDGRGVFSEAALTADEADEAFGGVKWEAVAVMGATRDTRYGAVRKRTRPDGLAVGDLSLDPDEAAGAEHGAFAYSTIGDTHQTRHVPHNGTARYRGGTAAVSGTGTLYTGEIDLLVRFRTQTVSGQITRLRDAEGRPWAYGRTGEEIDRRLFDRAAVGRIVLPDARLETKADWRRAKREPGEALVFYEFRARGPETVPATFAGHLVGRGRQAGNQAVGVWSVGEDRLDSTYIAGGFGADRVAASQPESRPASDEGGRVATAVLPRGAGPGPFQAEIADGVLELRGPRYGANLATLDPDDEAVALEGGVSAVQTHRLALDELFSQQDSEQIYDGKRFVELAYAEIERLRSALVRSIPLFDRTDMSLRDLVWGRIDEVIRYWLFGFSWLAEYPTRRGRAHDSKALETIEDVLAALESPVKLASALEPYGDGVFVGKDGKAIRETDAGQAWARVESRVRLRLGSTEYTRFGAWRKQTAVNAAADYVDRLEMNENGPDAFAYSLLPQTVWKGDEDRRFPLGASATYRGETVAVQGRTFYSGAVEVRVRWHDAWQQAEAGRLSVFISGLRDDGGDPLTWTDAGGSRTRIVDRMTFANVAVLVDGGRVGFTDDSRLLARIHFADRTASASPDIASVEGKFVGSSADGPLGAIGLWTAESGSRLGGGGRMRGSFGAELGP